MLVEKSHVRYEVLDNVHVGERVDARFLGGVRGNTACHFVSLSSTTCAQTPHTKAGQCVDSINVHGATSANSLATTPPEGQGRVHLVLDPDERIQHHGSRLVQVERIRLHLGLGRGLIWVPSVNVESLGLRILAGRGLLDCRCLALGDGLARGVRDNLFGRLGDGVAGVDVGYRGEAARENCRPYG